MCIFLFYVLSVEDADLLAAMGYNTIRLGLLWAVSFYNNNNNNRQNNKVLTLLSQGISINYTGR